MANLNKVMLIGRLTNEPEERVFTNGGKVAKFRFAVNNRKKNASTGQWEDDPVFLDVEAFNRGENGKQADLVMQYLRKGHQVFIEGHLKLDQWKSKEGENRSRIVVVADNFQFLEPRSEGMGDGSRTPRMGSAPAPRQPASLSAPSGGYDEPEPMDEPRGGSDDIPF
jgi:single-strand DNA-binding protein